MPKRVTVTQVPIKGKKAQQVHMVSVVGRSTKDATVAVPMVSVSVDHVEVALFVADEARENGEMLIDMAAAAEADALAMGFFADHGYDEQSIMQAMRRFAQSRITRQHEPAIENLQRLRRSALESIRIAERRQLVAFMREFFERRGVKGDELERLISGLYERLGIAAETAQPIVDVSTPKTA